MAHLYAQGRVDDAIEGRRPIYFGPDHGWLEAPIYRRDRLPADARFAGPAIIQEMSATAVLLPGQLAAADPFGNIIVTTDASAE